MKRILHQMMLGIFAVAIAICYALFASHDYKDIESVLSHLSGEPVIFNLESGLYEQNVEVMLSKDKSLPNNVKLLYTLDYGKEDFVWNTYTDSVVLLAEEEPAFYTIAAAIEYQGEISPVQFRVYVTGLHIKERFSLPLVCLSIDYDALYNEQTGIFTHYSERDVAWERSAHVVMFSGEGEKVLDQGIGLAVAGGSSAAYPVKSLKMVAGYAYDSDMQKLVFTDFYDSNAISQWSLNPEYNSLRLHSGSQDADYFNKEANYGNIRTALMGRLCTESGFRGSGVTERCIVYLNGKFYGIFSLQPTQSPSTLAKLYGLHTTEIEKISQTGRSAYETAGIGYLFLNDLNDPLNRALLEQEVDMDDYILYHALQILANNSDWPTGNYGIWRYTGNVDMTNEYSDNRWRCLQFDSDLIFYREGNKQFYSTWRANTFAKIMENEAQSFLPNVLASQHYRDQFLTVVSDLFNTTFAEEHLLKLVDEEYSRIREETALRFGETYAQNTDQYIELMKQAIRERKAEMTADILTYLGYKEKYAVDIQVGEGIAVCWNQVVLYGRETYVNEYYCGTAFEIEAKAYPGYVFDHWIVNDSIVDGEMLTVSEKLMSEGCVNIQAVAHRLNEGVLVISELAAKSSADWMKLSNVGLQPVRLDNYYLTDNDDNKTKYHLPQLVLKPGESIIINGKNNYYAIGNYICNFNLSEIDELQLTDGQMVVDTVLVPRMSDHESYGRIDNSCIFAFKSNAADSRGK